VATFRDNKQGIYGIFQYFLTTPNPLQNNITITEENITDLPHNGAKSDAIQKGTFISLNPDYTVHIFQRI